MSQTPRLSNDDFRKIMMTPARDQSSEWASGNATPARGSATPAKSSSSTFKKPRKMDPAEARKRKELFKQRQKEKEALAAKYRDRAKERREGVESEFEKIETQISQSNFYHNEELEELPDRMKKEKLIERSKLLGGDEEHTHLVKGLDYQLLAKVKSDIAKEERLQKEAERQKDLTMREAVNSANSFSRVISTEGGIKTVEATEFVTHVGKSVHNALFKKKTQPNVAHFLPGRMSFVFDLGEEAVSDLPTIVTRSKDDCPAEDELVLSRTHPEILKRLTKVMIYYHEGAKAYKKFRKKEKRDQQALKNALKKERALAELSGLKTEPMELENPSDDEDIFDDVDMSDVRITPVTGKFAKALPERPRSPPSRVDNAAPAKLPKGVPKQEAPKKPPMEDAYPEIYPGAYEGFALAEVDEDEPEDLMKLDSRSKLQRHYFEDDSQWEDYESNREATPSAAFQFGQKVKDGRKKAKFRERKLKKELKAVEGIIEKQDGGERILGRSSQSTQKKGRSFEAHTAYDSMLSQKRKADGASGDEPPNKKFKQVEKSYNKDINDALSLFK